MIRVFVNEKAIDISEGVHLREVLEQVNVPAERRGIAVAVNDRVIRRPEWSSHEVVAGDRIEIIQATQGG